MTAPLPFISVVMPAYNAERWIGEAIASVLDQDYPAVEVVVVEDGSTDGTGEVLAEIASERVRALGDGTNRGAPAARNLGLAAARGDLIKFLDADDLLKPGALRRQAEAIAALPNDTVVFDDAAFGEEHRHIQTVEEQADEAFSEDPRVRMTYFVECSIPTPCVLHRKALLERVGGFREDLPRAQEYDLHLRLAAASVRFKRIPRTGVWVREHDAPSRISNAQSGTAAQARHADANYRHRQRWIRIVTDAVGEPLPPRIARRFAKEAWIATRHMAQVGRTDLAGRYAEEALALDPGREQVASVPYTMLSRMLDPVRAELVLQRIRTALGR